jgi:hypothetical protein
VTATNSPQPSYAIEFCLIAETSIADSYADSAEFRAGFGELVLFLTKRGFERYVTDSFLYRRHVFFGEPWVTPTACIMAAQAAAAAFAGWFIVEEWHVTMLRIDERVNLMPALSPAHRAAIR